MLIEGLPLWLAQTNCWIVAPQGAGGEAVLIDAPPDPQHILERLAHHRLKLVAIFNTHGHVDHVGGVGSLVHGHDDGDTITVHIHDADRHMLVDPVEEVLLRVACEDVGHAGLHAHAHQREQPLRLPRLGSLELVVAQLHATGPERVVRVRSRQGHRHVHVRAAGVVRRVEDLLVEERFHRVHDEVNVVLSWEGSAVPGIITAIKEKNLVGKVVGVTNDITPQVISGIKDGIIFGSSKQNFCKMGSRVVDDLVALSKGKTIAKSVDTGITFVTKDNVATESN